MKLKVILWCIGLLIFIHAPAIAQTNNPIFYGGNRSGYNIAGYTQSSVTLNRGNIGDGYSTSGYFQSFNNITYGGQGDGVAYSNSSIPSTIKNALGGIGDGWASDVLPLTPLPIHLLSFTGIRVHESHQLDWEFSGNTVDSFIIERSTTANAFQYLGAIKSTETVAHALSKHQFVDKAPLAGNNFYRLKMFSKDKNITYSNTILLTRFQQNSTVSIYPNPTASILNISISNENITTPVVIRIYDMQSKRVQEQELNSLYKTHTIPVANLPVGVYALHIALNNQTQIIKFSKMN
jgi:hypothetical protein